MKEKEQIYDDIDISSVYIEEIKQNKNILTKEEERELIKKVKEGSREAEEEFIIRNLPLVISIAKKFNYDKIDFIDLVQEGNLALIDAVKKFDTSFDTKFSTYATEAIVNRIIRYADNYHRSLYLSIPMEIKIKEYYNALEKLYQIKQHTPTKEEIMEYLGWSEKIYKSVLMNIDDALSCYLRISFGEFEDVEVIDFIKDDRDLVEDVVVSSDIANNINTFFDEARLNYKEKTVLEYRYGLNGKDIKYLKDIASILGLSIQRVSQLESIALKKLKKCKYAECYR